MVDATMLGHRMHQLVYELRPVRLNHAGKPKICETCKEARMTDFADLSYARRNTIRVKTHTTTGSTLNPSWADPSLELCQLQRAPLSEDVIVVSVWTPRCEIVHPWHGRHDLTAFLLVHIPADHLLSFNNVRNVACAPK